MIRQCCVNRLLFCPQVAKKITKFCLNVTEKYFETGFQVLWVHFAHSNSQDNTSLQEYSSILLCGIYTSDCLLHTSDKYLSIGTFYSYQDQQLEMIVSCKNMSKVHLNVSLSWNPVTRGGKLFLWSKGHEFRVDICIHSAGFLFRRSVETSKKV